MATFAATMAIAFYELSDFNKKSLYLNRFFAEPTAFQHTYTTEAQMSVLRDRAGLPKQGLEEKLIED